MLCLLQIQMTYTYKICYKEQPFSQHLFLQWKRNDSNEMISFLKKKDYLDSSNMNEVIRAVLNFLFLFFTIRFHMYKKAQNVTKTIQFFNRSGTGFCTGNQIATHLLFYFLFYLNFKFLKYMAVWQWWLDFYWVFLLNFFWVSKNMYQMCGEFFK